MNQSFMRIVLIALFTYSINAFTIAQGPTKSSTQKAAISWPTKHPTKIYVLPFSMDKAVADELAKDDSLIPKLPKCQSRIQLCHVGDIPRILSKNNKSPSVVLDEPGTVSHR